MEFGTAAWIIISLLAIIILILIFLFVFLVIVSNENEVGFKSIQRSLDSLRRK